MYASPAFPGRSAAPEPSLHFHLFGSPTILWNDTTLAIPRRLVRALLFRLACDSEPVPRGHIRLLFWPDEPEAVARRNLSHLLTHLRRALPFQDVLVVRGDCVSLEPNLIWCDAASLKNASLGPQSDISLLQSLAGLYRGSFLEGFDLPRCPEFEYWCVVEGNTLEQRYLKILENLVEFCTSRGEVSQGIKYAQQYLKTDALSEVMHRRLIQLYASVGARQLALKQFERCSSILESDLGVRPLPETQAVYQAVLSGQSRFPEPSPPLIPPPLPGRVFPIFGREVELYNLEKVFSKLYAGEGHIAFISGEAGIGKSHLMGEFANQHEGEARILYGSGHAGEQAIPYQSILDVLHTILEFGDKESGQQYSTLLTGRPLPDFVEVMWLSEISRLLPQMHAIYPDLPPPLPLEREGARTRLFNALCHLIFAYATARGPVLLCLDDLQWMDAATRAWLVHTGRFLESGRYPILVLGTYRSEDAEEILELRHALARVGVLTEFKLTGLEEVTVLELLRHLVGGRSGDEVLASRLHQATGGNPFYIIEILRKLIEEGRLEKPFLESMQFTLPESVREAIQARVQRLSPVARQVLEAGAVLGQSFGIDLLRLTAGRSHIEITSAVEELTARVLIVEASQEYRFIHEITRQHVEESLGQVRRQLLHHRAAKAFKRFNPDAFPALAYHFEGEGKLQKALHYLELAAQRAHALHAWQVVEFHHERMLELLARIDPTRNQKKFIYKQASVFAERAHIRYLLGRLGERDSDLEALSDLAQACNDDRIRLQTILNRLRYLNQDGEYTQAITVAEKGLTLLKSSHTLFLDTEELCLTQSRLLSQIGFAYYFLGKPLDALDVLEDAQRLCQQGNDHDACGRILHILGYLYSHLADYPRSLDCQQQAYACHQQAEDYNNMAWDLIDIGALHKNLGDPVKALRCLQEGLELSRRVGSLQSKAYGLTHLGSLDLYQGNYAAAQAHYRQVLEMQQAIHSKHIIATAEAGVGFTLYHLGNYTKSRLWLERALQRARATGNRRRAAETLIQLGMLNNVEGRLPLARRHLEEGLAIARDSRSGECQVAGLAAMARLERLVGDPTCALEMAGEAVHTARQISQTGSEMWGEIEAGLAFLALGDLWSALEHTGRAVCLAPKAGQDWVSHEEAYCAHALVLRVLDRAEVADHYLQCAKNTLQSKANLIQDPALRRRFLSKLHPF